MPGRRMKLSQKTWNGIMEGGFRRLPYEGVDAWVGGDRNSKPILFD